MAFRRVQLWFSNVGLVGLAGLAGLAGLDGLDGLTVVLAMVWVHSDAASSSGQGWS